MTNNTITFELNGKTYIDTNNNNRFYVVEDGKKTRIGRDAYTEAFNQYVELAEAQIEEQEATEETERIAKELAPKKRTRKSKDVAFAVTVDGVETTLTAKQVDFIRHLPDTCFWENGLDSVIWVDCLCDDIGGQFKDKPMTVGAMISTLCEKGLGSRSVDHRNKHKCTSFALTGLGKVIAAELGLA